MKASTDKEVNRVVAEALHRGWTLDNCKRYRKLRLGNRFVLVASSPSCPHSFKNLQRDIDKIESIVNQKEK